MGVIYSIESCIYNHAKLTKCCNYDQIATGGCKAKGGSVVKSIYYTDYYFVSNDFHSHFWGAGFIWSPVVRYIIGKRQTVSSLSIVYAGNFESLESAQNSPRYSFSQADICSPRPRESFIER